MKSCSGGGKVIYTMGALPGSSVDFLLKTMFPRDKKYYIFPSMTSQANRNVLSEN